MPFANVAPAVPFGSCSGASIVAVLNVATNSRLTSSRRTNSEPGRRISTAASPQRSAVDEMRAGSEVRGVTVGGAIATAAAALNWQL